MISLKGAAQPARPWRARGRWRILYRCQTHGRSIRSGLSPARLRELLGLKRECGRCRGRYRPLQLDLSRRPPGQPNTAPLAELTGCFVHRASNAVFK